MAAPYTAAPQTAPTAMPTDDGRTGPPFCPPSLPGAPSWPSVFDAAAPLAELMGVPPLRLEPARSGMVGSIMLISVFTESLPFLASTLFLPASLSGICVKIHELGFNIMTDSLSTSSEGM